MQQLVGVVQHLQLAQALLCLAGALPGFARALGDALLQNLVGVHLLGDIAHDAEHREAALIGETPAEDLDVEDAAVAADVLRANAVLAASLQGADVVRKQGMARRVDKRRWMQAHHAVIPVHPAERWVRLDDNACLGVVDHQAVAAGLEDRAILGLLGHGGKVTRVSRD